MVRVCRSLLVLSGSRRSRIQAKRCKEYDPLKAPVCSLAMNENPVQRSLVIFLQSLWPNISVTLEHKDILFFFADNMYRFVQAKNELATIRPNSERGWIPANDFLWYEGAVQDVKRRNENWTPAYKPFMCQPTTLVTRLQVIQHELDRLLC